MPFYEFECRRCGARFERLLPAHASKEGVVCPHCESQETRRVFTPFHIGGKGGGASCASCASSKCSGCRR